MSRMSPFAIKAGVTYEFVAFPMTYWAKDRHRDNKGYRGGCLSTFTFDTLAEAQKEAARLRRIYKRTRDDVLERHKDSRLLKIFRVETRPVKESK